MLFLATLDFAAPLIQVTFVNIAIVLLLFFMFGWFDLSLQETRDPCTFGRCTASSVLKASLNLVSEYYKHSPPFIGSRVIPVERDPRYSTTSAQNTSRFRSFTATLLPVGSVRRHYARAALGIKSTHYGLTVGFTTDSSPPPDFASFSSIVFKGTGGPSDPPVQLGLCCSGYGFGKGGACGLFGSQALMLGWI
jgi:hypothetical protein